ncbi:MAG: glycine zipper family protein [Nitrospirae bacterium]|nr:glycine zipper family protein [Nitrospirota bacterium]
MKNYMPRRCSIITFGTMVSLLLLGCAGPKPVLYPNDHYETVGQEQAELDIAQCRELADAQISSDSKGMEVAQETAVGAGIGAASGAVIGAISGSAGKGAAVGAAVGATGGLLRSVLRKSGPSPTYKKFVNICLKEKGYNPIGWE